MVADELDYVVGVDTHLRRARLGGRRRRPRARCVRRTVGAGERARLRAALRFARRGSQRRPRLGDRGHRQLRRRPCPLPCGRGETVLEVSRTPRAERRLRGKDDSLDAARTARAALASETLALPRSGERREALRLLLVARRSAVDVRREALGQLRGVIVTAPDGLREQLRGLPVGRLLERCSRLRRSSTVSAGRARDPARVAQPRPPDRGGDAEADQLEQEILGHVRALAPRLLDEPGVGPIVAAQLIVAWSHRGRSAPRPPSPASPASPRSPPPAAKRPAPAQPRRRPATQPRPAHRRPAPPPARPRDQGLHRPTDRRGQEPPRRHPPAQALPRPPPLPATATGAADDLTSHRSIIPGLNVTLGLAAADSIPGCRLLPTCQRCVAAAFPRPSSVT